MMKMGRKITRTMVSAFSGPGGAYGVCRPGDEVSGFACGSRHRQVQFSPKGGAVSAALSAGTRSAPAISSM
jgi:hypothetical protein